MVKQKNMLFVDFPPLGCITEKVKTKNQKRIFTGGIRINNGMFRTDEQVKKYRELSLKRRLP